MSLSSENQNQGWYRHETVHIRSTWIPHTITTETCRYHDKSIPNGVRAMFVLISRWCVWENSEVACIIIIFIIWILGNIHMIHIIRHALFYIDTCNNNEAENPFTESHKLLDIGTSHLIFFRYSFQQTTERLIFLFDSTQSQKILIRLNSTHNGFTRIDSNQLTTQNFWNLIQIDSQLKIPPGFWFKSTHDSKSFQEFWVNRLVTQKNYLEYWFKSAHDSMLFWIPSLLLASYYLFRAF